MKVMSRIAAWSLLIIAIVGLAIGGYLDAFVNPQAPGEEPTTTDLLWVLSFIGFPVVGSVIVFRLPRHAIGWILCGLGGAIGLMSLSAEYAQYAYVTRGGDAVGGAVAAWITSWIIQLTSALIILLFVLFPQGHPRNAFWKWVTRFVLVGAGALSIMYSLRSGPLDNSRDVNNPFGVDALNPYIKPVIPVLGAALGVIALTAIVDKFVVYRASTGDERQQLRWFAFAALLFPLLFAFIFGLMSLFGAEEGWGPFDPVLLTFIIGFNALAVAIGIAVFKYRLYDIGVVVNKTLVYGALTAILAGTYAGLVVVLQTVLQPVTANSDLAIAASTLGVAALFHRIRRRVQSFIDRRFYRRKFDAQRTIESFGLQLRDEVSVERLSSQLITVVSDTMEPQHVSLWLRTQ